MGIPHPGGSPADTDDPRKTPPLRTRGRALMRAIAIVSVFVFAGSMLMWVQIESSNGVTVAWTELLVVPGFVLGVIMAAVDFLWQRRR